jgi:hypothetical protein
MTPLDIPHLRLYNQRIASPNLSQPGEVVGWLGAVQAQDYAGAKWAVGLRSRGATDPDIEQAFATGAILRTHLLRPTWHFVTPADIRWLLALTAPRVHALNAPYYRRLEFDQDLIRRSHDALGKELQGGQQRTREELRAVLQQAGIATAGELRMSYLMMQAELDGIVCSGPRRGKQFTYMLLEERAPHARTLEREEAVSELARRYFLSRGPATVQDFARWSGLAAIHARQGLAAVKAQLHHEAVDGQSYWFPPSMPPGNEGAPTAYLLSIYDEYISGYKDRRAIAGASIATRLVALGNALTAIIVLDGQIVGTWKRTLRKDTVLIETKLFSSLAEAENHAITAAAHRYGAFLNLRAVLS